MSTSIRDRVIDLLGQNIQQSLVASAVGVTDSYISQLLLEPEVIAAIATKKAGKLESAIAKDDSLDSIEKQAMDAVKSKLPFVRSAVEAAKVFQIFNSARRAAQADTSSDNAGVQIVQIRMPKAGAVMIQLNSTNQVIDVAGRSMAPLPSRALPALASSIADAKLVASRPTPQQQDAAIARDRLANLANFITVVNGQELTL